MPRSRERLGLMALIGAGLRRSPWQTAAGLFAGLVAAGALVAALGLLSGMQQLLDRGLDSLGGDLVLSLPGHRAEVERWVRTGSTEPIPARIDVTYWQRRLREAKILGLTSIQGVDLGQGGAGEPNPKTASLLVLRLEFWASPMMAEVEIGAALPDTAIVVGEQATRHVLTDLQPLVRHLSSAAGVALLAAVLISGLLAAIRVGQRRAELGMLRAVGATRSYMVSLTLGESALLALLGGGLGVLLGLGALWFLPAAGGLIRHLPAAELLRLAALAVGGTALASAAAAVGPALQTARLDPLDAVRRNR